MAILTRAMRSLLTNTLIIIASLSSTTLSTKITPIPSTDLDLSQLGRVALFGDFDAATLVRYTTNSPTTANNGSQGLLTRFPFNGAFATLDSSDSYINALCSLPTTSVIVGGNFTSLGGVNSPGVALYNTSTGLISPIPGLNGRVNALYCDTDSSTVYIGGMFTVTGVNASNAVAWSSSGFHGLPFEGFDGAVNSIVKDASGNLVFGGSFTGLSNTTSTGTALNSQVVPLTISNVTAVGSSNDNQFSSPTNVVCKDPSTDGPGAAWLTANNTQGNISLSFNGFGFNPTLLRIKNTNFSDDGTKEWFLRAQPSGGIMNFTYFDQNGAQKSCTNQCPLAHNSTVQDFYFVNTVGMTGFTVYFTKFYGSAAGISSFEVFENDIFSFAVGRFNEPNCPGIPFPSSSTVKGNWSELPGAIGNPNYLSTTIDTSIDPSQHSVVFSPDIKQQGNYTIYMYTPGCKQDNSCSTRGVVNVTATLTAGGNPYQTTLFQTNDYEKYDQIFLGQVGASSSSFKPTVTLTPASGQSGQLTIVAERVQFVLKSSSGGLNGIFEWNPRSTSIDMNFRKSTLDTSATSLDSSAVINSLISASGSIFVGGQFTGSGVSNFLQIGNSSQTSASGGLNGAVNTMYQNGSAIYVGGAFTSTSTGGNATGLNGIAAYNLTTNTWNPLGAGLNGVVDYIIPIQLNLTNSGSPSFALAVSGQFTQILATAGAPAKTVNNFAIWIPSRNNWLSNLDIATTYIQGTLTASTDTMSGPFYAGSISSFDLTASSAVEIDNSLKSFPVSFASNTFTSQRIRKRQASNTTIPTNGTSSAESGILAGALTTSGRNFTVFAGDFTATGSNNTAITDLVIIDGSGQVYGLPAGLLPTSSFTSVDIVENLLFAGGTLSGTVNGNNVSGLVVYDLDGKKFGAPQPPALSSSLGTGALVTAIKTQPDTLNVYVAGLFDTAGSIACSTLCAYDAQHGQWSSPGTGLAGSVSSMSWADNQHLLLTGSLTVNGTSAPVAVFNAQSRAFTTYNSAGAPSGSIDHITPALNNGSDAWVAGRDGSGTAFLAKYQNGQWDYVNGLGSNSTIRGIQYFTVSKAHASAALMDSNHALLVLGDLDIPAYGHVSSAVFNGTNMIPYVETGKNGTNGFINGIAVANPNNFFSGSKHHLAVGFIVLIALAVSLALIFLLTLLGLLMAFLRRRRQGYRPAPGGAPGAGMSENLRAVPPGELLSGVGGGGSLDRRV